MVRFLEALITEGEALDARDAGRPVDVEKLAPLKQTLIAEVGLPAITIETLLENWKAEGGRKPKTVDEYASIAREFQAFVVQYFKLTQAVQIKKSHLIAYRKHLFDQNLHFKTVGKRISTIRTLFKKAIDDELLTDDPTHLVKVKRPKNPPKARVPFATDELKVIFSSGCYAPGVRPAPDDENADFWAPLTAIFSGMRIEEICQLRVLDVRQDKELGWYLLVQDGEGQSVKTASSRRQVPIHQELERIGFIEFVQRQKDRRAIWLFPELPVDKYGRRSSAFSKRWNKAARKLLGLPQGNRKKVFHSFRHLFKHAARYVRLSEEIHDAITGHAREDSEGRGYGDEMYPLPPLVEAMKLFRVPDLDLSHLYPVKA